MERMQRGFDQIGKALDLLPEGIRVRTQGTHFLTGINPLYAGLSNPGMWWERHPYLPDQRVIAACCYPEHTRDRSLTIVLLVPVFAWGVVHELGHALAFREGLRDWEAEPVSEYARNSRREAFAEAFVARFYRYGDLAVRARDRATAALFDQLERPPV